MELVIPGKSIMQKLLIYIILASVLTVSCRKILFSDEMGLREIQSGSFSAVTVNAICNLILVQDSSDRLVITGKNSISYIDAVVINDTLFINDNKKMSFEPGRNTIELHFTILKYLVTREPVNVTNTDTIRSSYFSYDAIGEISEVKLAVECDYFAMASSANTLGIFHISGKAGNASFFNRYGCKVSARDLYCRNAEIINESAGDVHIAVSENLRAYIWGPGNIFFYGDPTTEVVEKKGEGRLIRVR